MGVYRVNGAIAHRGRSLISTTALCLYFGTKNKAVRHFKAYCSLFKLYCVSAYNSLQLMQI